MSTGDQSQYVRAKMAERGSNAQAKFMMDGFDRWAESTAPAREGQMEKIPAESQMASYGGAMTLSKARQKLLKLEGMHELEGGVDIVPQSVKDAANEAKKIIQIWRGISSRIDSFMEELQDQIIDDPKRSPSLIAFAKSLKQKFEQIKFLKDILDGAAKLAESVGLGKKRKHSVKLHGGASLSWSDLAGYAKQITALYSWLKQNADNMRTILAMKSLQPEGKQILDVVDPILKAVGMGRHGGMKHSLAIGEMEHCQCAHGGRKRAAKKVVMLDDFMGGRHGGAAIGLAPAMVMSNDYYEKKYQKPMDDSPKRAAQDVNSPYVHKLSAVSVGGRRHGGAHGGRAPSARGAIVKKVMAQHGLSLPQASKYVKEHGLY